MAFTRQQYEAYKELDKRGALSPERQQAFIALSDRGAFSDFTAEESDKQPEIQENEPISNAASVTPEMGITRTGPDEYTEVEPIESIPIGEALKQGITNLPESAKKQVTSIIDAVKQPSQTWDGLKTLAKDIYKSSAETAIRSTLTEMGFKPSEKLNIAAGSFLEDIEETPALDIMVEDLKNTYGSYERFKHSIAKDPARVIVDIGSMAAPAAKGVEAAATAAKLPTVAKAAGALSKGAALADPITAAATGTKQVIKTGSKLTGEVFKSLKPTGLYKSAAKMSTKLSEADRNKLANFALDNEIMPTLNGLKRIDESIYNIDSKISAMIDEANISGKTMPIGKLFNDFEALKSERMLSAKPLEGVRSVNRIKKSMLEANAKIKRGRLSPKEVQQLKQTVYKDLKGAYESMKSSNANIKAQKAVARSAKEYLESLLPEIKQLNKTDGDLIKLRGALEGPASRISNRDISGLGPASKIGGGSLTGGMIGGGDLAAIGATGGLVLAVLDDPVVKAKLAIVLNKLQKKGVTINENRAIMRLLSAQALKTADTIEDNK